MKGIRKQTKTSHSKDSEVVAKITEKINTDKVKLG